MLFGKTKISYAEVGSLVAKNIVPVDLNMIETSNPLGASESGPPPPPTPSEKKELCVFSLFAFVRGMKAAVSDEEKLTKLAQAVVANVGGELVARSVFAGLPEFLDLCSQRFDVYEAAVDTSPTPQGGLMALSAAVLAACGRDRSDLLAAISLTSRFTNGAIGAKGVIQKLVNTYRIVE